jgi:glucose-1-phosphate cytidylyltransferase
MSFLENMKINTALILAGGRGTRFKEQTETIPKPMIKANGKPLLDYIINSYSIFGVKKIIILGGYKQEVIYDYYKKLVKILDTGVETGTAGRVKAGIKEIDENFFYLTYGDGIANVDIKKLTIFHFNSNAIGTVTAVRPPARFGSLKLNKDYVTDFAEKDLASEGYINGGFFVFSKELDKYLIDINEPLEQQPLKQLAANNNLRAYKHSGYWRPVDTIRELEILENDLNENKLAYE